jgi:photosystem II stability/assembly factor-like uncharacterized protein
VVLFRTTVITSALVAALAFNSRPTAQPVRTVGPIDQKLFAEMRWRSVGPHRGGRTKSAAGHPSQPYTFYIGVCNGGVWKTTDAGRTWTPIFDSQQTGSIGSLVVAPSDPNVLYVGSGEGLGRPDLSVGDGVYKSTDAGKTWTHLGLRDGQQIPNIAVDPGNANRLFVAVAGHPYGPNEERGIFRSTDGGQSFQKVLFKDVNTGGNDVDIDPSNPAIVYATLWEERQGPWENAQWRGTGGGIYKSTDGGATWKQLTNGLPQNGAITQANLAIAPSNPKRVYAAVAVNAATSFYRSDDSGETWTQITQDNRPVGRIGGGDLAVPIVNPKDPDTIISASTVAYKSTDGGKSWIPFKGAPGGDDYQNGWINPNEPNIILLVADQGAVVTLNGGDTWSSWYNQPTAQLYHVNTDNDFPYRVCGGQQESGSACVASRGNDGQITFREWHPVAVEEYGYAVPDPRNPDIVYGGKITRYDRRTAQNQNISPVPGGRGGPAPPPGTPVYRTVRTLPVNFSPVDERTLFFGNNYLWKTIDGGVTWKRLGDDPTRKTYELPPTIGKYSDPSLAIQRGVVYSIAPSYIDVNRIWIGTDDGVIKTTTDGGVTWKDVTPPGLKPWMKVFNMDAGRFDAQTAYAAINTLRLDDMRPHLWRTHDGGATWTEINTGMEDGGPTSSIREDPRRKGLLYAASERRVYVSFDDGDHWQSLQLNMAPSSVRDIIVKDDDLVAATHGRGFWILDNLTPLRQIESTTAGQDAVLFMPAVAYRVRWNTNTDTPLPPDEPGAPNPPEGAIIDYYLKDSASGPVTFDVTDADGRLVRHYSSADPVVQPDPINGNLPLYWFRPPMVLSTSPGMHRFTWDVHYQPLAGIAGGRGGLPIAAVPYNTLPAPTTPWVNPGSYTVKLTVNGKTYSQPITVKQDPRVKAPPLVMQRVYSLTKAAYTAAADAQEAAQAAQSVRDQIAKIKSQATGATATALDAFDKKIEAAFTTSSAPPPARGTAGVGSSTPFQPPAGQGQTAGGRGGRGNGIAGGSGSTLNAPATALAAVMNSLQSADVQPTALQVTAIETALTNARAAMARWNTLKTTELAALNTQLKAAGLTTIGQAP